MGLANPDAQTGLRRLWPDHGNALAHGDSDDPLPLPVRKALVSSTGQHLCHIDSVGVFGVRELRQNASEILREVEAGEAATVTVAGRPVAQIVPLSAQRWTTWEEIRQVFDSLTDSGWDAERREFVRRGLDDPWER